MSELPTPESSRERLEQIGLSRQEVEDILGAIEDAICSGFPGKDGYDGRLLDLRNKLKAIHEPAPDA